jgi:hypothetical protein
MNEYQLQSFNCQKCCGSGTITSYKYVKNKKTITEYTCQCCGHNNTKYILNDDIDNFFFNAPRKWR